MKMTRLQAIREGLQHAPRERRMSAVPALDLCDSLAECVMRGQFDEAREIAQRLLEPSAE